jgi:hypothetical protein
MHEAVFTRLDLQIPISSIGRAGYHGAEQTRLQDAVLIHVPMMAAVIMNTRSLTPPFTTRRHTDEHQEKWLTPIQLVMTRSKRRNTIMVFMGQPKKTRARRIPTREWVKHRAEITRLYEGSTLDETREFMAKERGFKAMYGHLVFRSVGQR